MKDAIRATLASNLLYKLQTNPSSTVEDGIKEVLDHFSNFDLGELDVQSATRYLTGLGESSWRQAVLNPHWLMDRGDEFHFYFVSARPGWLQYLLDQMTSLEAGISRYVLYSDWDSLLILYGNKKEARYLLDRIKGSTEFNFFHFSAHSIPYFHRYRIPPLSLPSIEASDIDEDTINRLVARYDTEELASKKEELIGKKVILGPTWTLHLPISTGISAFVAMKLQGRTFQLEPNDVLDNLLHHEILKDTLVHLFETDTGQPYHYLAKLICRDMNELDEATNAISFAKIGQNVRLEGNTYIVAHGNESLPNLRSERGEGIIPSPVLINIEEMARQTIGGLGDAAVDEFNRLSGTMQLIVLRSLIELNQQADRRSWDEAREKSIRSAISSFAQLSLKGPGNIRMAGAVMELAPTVENFVQEALRLIIERAYGSAKSSYIQAQRELKLPTRNLSEITLGKATVAFQTMKVHSDFAFLTPIIEDSWIAKLESFADLRNSWAHSRTSTDEEAIDEARRALVEGIGLVRWIGGTILPMVKPIDLSNQPDEREPGVFIIHSSKDGDVATKVADALKALAVGYKVFYAEWSIKPGDSIVDKISDGLARRNDTFVVLLSPNSVNSEWVKRELDSALMAQLSGENVLVLPVLIEECYIPGILRAIKRIDLRPENWRTGFIELFNALSERYSRSSN